jgi:hypothetical protein
MSDWDLVFVKFLYPVLHWKSVKDSAQVALLEGLSI